MLQVLVYGDSLSWGIIPNTRKRLSFEERWPGVMEFALTTGTGGLSLRVIEDCLNGRRTAWEDPFKPGRNGLVGLEQRMEIHSPLAMVIVMLGTNDFQSMHVNNARLSAFGLAAIVRAIRRAPIEPGMPVPEVLVVAPPPIRATKGDAIAPKFVGAEEKCIGLADALKQVAAEEGCHYFDAGGVIEAGVGDGVHLDAEQHPILGRAIAEVVRSILGGRRG